MTDLDQIVERFKLNISKMDSERLTEIGIQIIQKLEDRLQYDRDVQESKD